LGQVSGKVKEILGEERGASAERAVADFPNVSWKQWNDFFDLLTVFNVEDLGISKELQGLRMVIDEAVYREAMVHSLRVGEVLLISNPTTIHTGDKTDIGYIAYELLNRYFPISESGKSLISGD